MGLTSARGSAALTCGAHRSAAREREEKRRHAGPTGQRLGRGGQEGGDTRLGLAQGQPTGRGDGGGARASALLATATGGGGDGAKGDAKAAAADGGHDRRRRRARAAATHEETGKERRGEGVLTGETAATGDEERRREVDTRRTATGMT
uniref:Uncharacterized protein n=1 Tax=Oryza sativa subsp. japonica TaxID=39947 RepID=Q6YSH8_ORYSJ|nr:hypothetical protein [Oryza sativa Japonica Group]BAD31564.1 hypothetical protein [Oryza sativa Japonica Group]